MRLVFLRRAVACALPLFAGGVLAASVDETPSLDSLLTHSSSVAISQGTMTGEAAHRGRMQQYANGDTLLFQQGAGDAVDVPVMVILCERSAYFNTVGGLPTGGPLSNESLKAVRIGQYMTLLGNVAMVQGAVGHALQLPANGTTLDATVETGWAYGKEQFSLRTTRLADSGVRFHMIKRGNRITIPASDPDDMFSTDDDRAARLAELEPVGAWRELVISATPRMAEIPAEMSLKGWVDDSGHAMANVGEARQACTPR